MTRRAKIAWAVSLLVVACCASLIVWVATTGSGLRLVWSFARPLIPGRISVATLEGDLLGPFEVTGLQLAIGSLRVTIGRATIEWNPFTLLRDDLTIDSLRADDVSVEYVAAPAPTRGRFSLPAAITLPFDLTIAAAVISQLTIRAGDSLPPITADRALLSLQWDGRDVQLRDVAIEGPNLEARGRITVAPRGNYAGRGEAEWTYRPEGYPAIVGGTTFDGTAEAVTIAQSIAAPYGVEARISIVDALSDPELAGSITLQTALAEIVSTQPVDTLAGQVMVAGPIATPMLSGDITLASAALIDAAVSFVTRYEDRTFNVESLHVTDTAGPATVDLAGRVSLSAAPFDVELNGRWSSLQWPLRGDPLAVSQGGSLELSATAEVLQADFDAQFLGGKVQGQLERNAAKLDGRFEWQDIAYPATSPTLVSQRGTLQLEGQPDDYRLILDADLASTQETGFGTRGQVRAAGSGTRDSLQLERLDLNALGGSVTGSAGVSWRPVLAGSVDLELRNVDTSYFSEAWPGNVSGSIEGGATTDADRTLWQADDIALTGTLRERPLAAQAQGTWSARAVSLDRLNLTLGGTAVTARGSLGDSNDFAWTLESESLEDLWPGIGGRLSTSGKLAGSLRRPFIEAEARGGALEFGATHIGELELAATIDVNGADDSALDLSVRDASLADHDVSSLVVSGKGNADRHDLSVSTVMDDVEATLVGSGNIANLGDPDFEWRLNLTEARVTYAALAPWTLERPSSLSVTAERASIQQACWRSQGAALCVDGSYTADLASANFELTDLPLQYFEHYLPVGSAITGVAQASGQFSLVPDKLPEMDVDVTTSNSWIGPADARDFEGGLAFAPGSARVSWDVEDLAVELHLPLEAQEGGLDLDAEAHRSASERFASSSLGGKLSVALGDLGFVAELMNGVDNTGGALNADLALSGTIEEPRLRGQAELTNGTARLLGPGIVLENASATLNAQGTGTLAFAAHANSGGGEMSATGALRFAGSDPIGRIDIQGTNFEFLSLPAIRALASPELVLDLQADRADVSGRVLVPQAAITLPDNTEGVARVSPDQIIVDAELPRQNTGLTRPLFARLTLELGDDVTFDGLGLKGRLEGGLQIVETPTDPPSGSGELRIVNGTYEAYRQQLEIRTGRLLFAGGALSRPGLDIEAVRRPAEDILVGARIRGTLDRPELVVFSEPAMPRQEQLSYLLLGRPLERTSTEETSALSQAALLLGLSGSDLLSEKINRSLGFQEFGIQTQSGEKESASFVIGRYLAPSLYVSYGIGLFQQVNTLRLRYRISNRWRLETESSSESSGGDVIYHIERNP